MKNFLLFIFLAVFVTIPFGCKKNKKNNPDPDPQPRPGEVVVNPVTKVVDDDTRNAIVSIDSVNFTFTFNGGSEVINSLAVGDILVDGPSEKAPFGYLRKVTAIQNKKDGTIEVQTTQGKLAEAVPQGTIDYHSGNLKYSQLRSVVLSDGVKLNKPGSERWKAFDFSYDKTVTSGNSSFTVKGDASLDLDFIFQFDWSFQLDWDVMEVDKFKIAVDVDQSSTIGIYSETGISYNDRITLASMYFQPVTFMVGPVPVVLVPKVDLFMEADGTISAELTASAGEHYENEIGVVYSSDDGWDGLFTNNADLDYQTPDISSSTNFEVHVGPEVKVLLYNVVGPRVSLTGCAALDATLISPDNWDLTLDVGLRGNAGVEFSLLGFDFSKDFDPYLFCYKKTLFELNGEPLANSLILSSPVEGHNYLSGNHLTLSATSTGELPQEVKFYIDDNLVGTDNSKPYEYDFDTKDLASGLHTAKAEAVLSNETLESGAVSFNLVPASWTPVDMSGYGMDAGTIFTDVFFYDNDEGWLSGGDPYGFGGFVLHTTDGGQTWNNGTPDLFPRIEQLLFINPETGTLKVAANGAVYANYDQEWGFWYICENGNMCYSVTFQSAEIFRLGWLGNRMIALGRPYSEDNYYIYFVDDMTEPAISASEKIPYLYPDMGNPVPVMGTFLDKALVVNLKSSSNPLRQYYMKYDGNSWESKVLNVSGITPEDDLNFVYYLNENDVFIVGRESNNESVVLISHDGGDTWDKVNVPEAGNFTSIAFTGPNTGFATDYTTDVTNGDPGYKLFKTEDGGQTWYHVDDVYTTGGMYDVSFIGSEKGYCVGRGATIFQYGVGK